MKGTKFRYILYFRKRIKFKYNCLNVLIKTVSSHRLRAICGSILSFLLELAEVFNYAASAAWFTCDTGVTTMQDQPMVCIDLELVGYELE